LERKRGCGVDGEVGVEKNGTLELERANEIRGDAGQEEETATEAFGELVAVGEDRGFAGIEEEAGGNRAESGEPGRVATQRVGLSGDEGLRGREKNGAIGEVGRVHKTS
jgi:hypothetical protein